MKELRSTLRSLALIYTNYGGVLAILKSPFLHCSALGAVLSWPALLDGSWPTLAKAVLPNLAGFSIAAYAIIFAVLDAKSREALSIPISEFDNRSPFLVLVSSISHAVIVQIVAIFIAAIFDTRPFPYVESLKELGTIANVCISFIGLTITLYGILLVISSILILFRLLSIVQKSK